MEPVNVSNLVRFSEAEMELVPEVPMERNADIYVRSGSILPMVFPRMQISLDGGGHPPDEWMIRN